MSIEIIQAKRTVLVAQRDQLMAQFNMTNGAVAACDELLAEILVEASRRKAAEAELQKIAEDMAGRRRRRSHCQVEGASVGSKTIDPGTIVAMAAREVDDTGDYVPLDHVPTPSTPYPCAPAGMTPPTPTLLVSVARDNDCEQDEGA